MRIQLKGPGLAANLLAELNRCRQTRQYCDVFLQVSSRTFAAHRAVLACAGTYFHSLFSQPPATASAVFSLEFISPVNFEKVLTFVYTGELLIDLIDVGVLYELAERLGVGELMRACHATFPDLQASVSAKEGSAGDLPLDPVMVSATSAVAAISSTSICSSSAASCSSLSSSAGPSTVPTPAAAPSPVFQTGASRKESNDRGTLSVDLKAEDIQSHISYGQMAVDLQLQTTSLLTSSSLSCEVESVLRQRPVLQLKTEQDLDDEGTSRHNENCGTPGEVVSESRVSSLPRSSDPTLSDSCSPSESSAELRAEACAPSSSSGDPPGSLQVMSVEGGVANKEGDSSPMFTEVQTGQSKDEKKAPEANGEEPWRQLAGEIIELSDDETYMEDGDDADDDDDLVCLENGDTSEVGSQVIRNILTCKACSASLPADPFFIRKHGESHLTELGLCKVCGSSFPDRTAGVCHVMTHVGVQLFTCDMCHAQFCSQNKLLRHHYQTASSYSLPQGALVSSSSQNLGSELKCSVCLKILSKGFQTVRDHLLSHVCSQNLTCGVCHLPHNSLCSLLWHTLTHLSLPVFTCPHCACCFVEQPLLDRHMVGHAEEATAEERERLELRANKEGSDSGEGGATAGAEEMRCFLCPQTFRSSSAFQFHLSQHTTEPLGGGGGIGAHTWSGKRKADQSQECPLSSCSSSTSPRDTGGLSKISNLGLGLGMVFSVPEKIFQGPVSSMASGVLTNGCSGLEGAAGATVVREKWYRCRYCGKRFAHSGEFTYHLRIHTGEKPYQCKVCLRFFRGRSTMICHLKTHAGALMYRCTVCGFYFSTLKLVSSHMELHKEHLPPDFNIEQTFMYNDHSKEPLRPVDN
nr:zinc finger and BTB domain-containing protein 39 [Nothobranchius furzeri]